MNALSPIGGLLVGTLLLVAIPYLRRAFTTVSETGDFKSWPRFDWRYLAMFVLPVIEYSVAFLTVPGLWEAALTWELIPAIALGWAGTGIGKELIQTGTAVYKIVDQRI